MSLIKRIGLKSPVLRKSQRCEACGQSFACEISLHTGCWCQEVHLSELTRAALRTKYRNCLCRACLEKAETTNARTRDAPG
jgi:hypothetical protein